MSSASEQAPLNPNDPEYYAPPWLRERATSRPSLLQEARSEPISPPIFVPAALDIQRNPLAEVIHEPAKLARRHDAFTVAARLAAAAAVATVAVLAFVILKPASRQSDAGSTSSEITGSIRTALPQSGQRNVGSKPALGEFQALVGSKPAIAEFQGLLASVPPSQPATQEQSQPLLQQFLQWGKKANTAETSR
jgi:hypothetical protein